MSTYSIEIKDENKKLEYYETVFPRINEFYENNYKTVEINKDKANKYDSLVEKIKEEIADLEVPILIYGGRGNGRTYARAEKEAKKYILKHILELLDTEKGE